ncbi:hypothetical protein Tco_0198169 [Tanacetum coccineum]
MSRIDMSMLTSKGNIPDVKKSKFIQKAMALHLLHQSEDPATMTVIEDCIRSCGRFNANIRSREHGNSCRGSKMLWADSASTTYLIYRIPYVPIGLPIPEEEWRGKDTSLAITFCKPCLYSLFVRAVCAGAIYRT